MSDVSAINNYVKKFEQLKKEIAKVIVGQDARVVQRIDARTQRIRIRS